MPTTAVMMTAVILCEALTVQQSVYTVQKHNSTDEQNSQAEGRPFHWFPKPAKLSEHTSFFKHHPHGHPLQDAALPIRVGQDRAEVRCLNILWSKMKLHHIQEKIGESYPIMDDKAEKRTREEANVGR
ncbi:hypothetical protein MG293_019300 [Ovis ammon polii]|uniref:Secreted protein n=1 Tax=Ovis ammon polii TaxID=230172 RepID=A0AAD4Y1V8_OVIAM|nr:hypothetical protein MG293_019300 [Ovis ammon polii]